MDEDLYSLSAAATELGINQHTLKRWIDEGYMDFGWIWIGQNRARCLTESQLEGLRDTIAALEKGWSLKTAFKIYWTKMKTQEEKEDEQ